MATTVKFCSACKTTKALSAFAKCARDGYQSQCKTCKNAVSTAWNKAHKRLLADRMKVRRDKDVVAARAKEKKARQANPENHRARHKKWYDKNKKREQARWAKWSAENSDALIAKQHKRRAKQAGNGGSFTAAEAAYLKASYLGRCAYCFDAKAEHLDHVVPIKHGGTSNIENMVPACAACNFSKNARSLLSFLVRRKAIHNGASYAN